MKKIIFDYDKVEEKIAEKASIEYYRGGSIFTPEPTEEYVKSLIDDFIKKYDGEVV